MQPAQTIDSDQLRHTPSKASNKDPVIIAVIAAYNEQKNIKNITEETSKHVTSIVVVDDGSSDDTAKSITTPNTIVIHNKRNLGKGAALRIGFNEALKHDPDIVVTLDADGQHDPADIPRLISPIQNKQADVVIGSRYTLKTLPDIPSLNEIPIVRRFGLAIINLLNKFLIKNVKDTQSGFRAYSRTVLGVILQYNTSGYGAEVEQLATADLHGFSITEIPVKIRYRGLQNTSKKNSVLQGADIVSTILRIAVERKPLFFFGLTGIILIASAIIPASDMLSIFNKTRYFSLPLAFISFVLFLTGSLLILISFVFYALKRIRDRLDLTLSSLSERRN